MDIIDNQITGKEVIIDIDSPYAALVNFYNAFNHRDFALMKSNWLQTDESSMSNPLGGVKRGWDEINHVYNNIFNGKPTVYVEFYDYTIHQSENMFIAVGRERGTLNINETSIELSIRTSRAYRRQNNEWKQLHHHGSMDNPELLASYQTTILNNQ